MGDPSPSPGSFSRDKKEGSPPAPPPKKKTQPSSSTPSPTQAEGEGECGQELLIFEAEERRLPRDWLPKEEHTLAVEAEMRQLRASRGFTTVALRSELDGQDENIREFARLYAEQKAAEMRRWAITYKRTHPNWDERFHEWLRKDSVGNRRERKEPAVIVDGKPITLGDIALLAVMKNHARMAAEAEARKAEEARKRAAEGEWCNWLERRRKVIADMRWYGPEATNPIHRKIAPDKAAHWDAEYEAVKRWEIETGQRGPDGKYVR